jgi:thiol-disulfide isomerase/thioredoxin
MQNEPQHRDAPVGVKPKCPRRTVMREAAIVLGLGVLIVGVVVALRGSGGGGGHGLAESPVEVHVERGTLELSSLVGRPSALVFWATWCAACADELPDLERLAESGHKVLAISREPLAKTMAFTKARGLSVPLASDRAGASFLAFGVEVLPTIIVFDAAGHPVEVQRGGGSYEDLHTKLTALER